MRIHILALLASVSLAVSAQMAPADPPKPAPPKVDAKKVEAKKDEAKKPAAKKPPPKPAVAKKPEAPKKPEPAKAPAPPKKPIEIKTMNTDKPLVLRDKDGNVIPTSPDAYNVDSALPPKKR
jgi:hypothetical protein